MRHSLFVFSAFSIFCVVPPARAASAGEAWWNAEWKCRYELTIAPGAGNVAWVRFAIPPGCQPQGEDVRIIDDRGQEARREALFFEPAIYGVAAFDVSGSGRRHWLYLGNPEPGTRAEAWTAQAGVFLTTRRMGEGQANNPKQMQQLMERSTWAFGAGFRPNIFDGFNPYGDPDRFVSQYTGWLRVTQSGRYLFATVSDDASFLYIDGELVCQWPGVHTADGGRRGRFNGKVDLDPGIHRLDYYQCDFGDAQTAEAAWMPPGARQPSVISESDFVPIRAAQPGRLEIRGQSLAPDFAAAQEEWLHAAGNTYTVYTFSDMSSSAGGRIVSRMWQFSDGWAAVEEKISKMFFHDGDFMVKLTVRDDRGGEASVERPFRVHAIDRAEPSDDPLLAQVFANLAESAKLDTLDRADAVNAGRLLVETNRALPAAQLYEKILTRESGGLDDADLALAYLDLMAGPLRQPDRGIEIARMVLQRLEKNPQAAAQLGFRLGRAELDQLRRPQEALTDFKAAGLRVEQAKSPDPAIRRDILIGLGDAFRALGNRDEAYASYAEAEKIPLPNASKNPFDISSYALTAESRLLTRDYEEARAILDQWEREHPTERLVGYSSILRARLEMELGNYEKAVGELEACLACKPVGVFAKQATLALADLYALGGGLDKARRLYEQLLEQFQDEDVQAAARRGLEQLGEPGGPRLATASFGAVPAATPAVAATPAAIATPRARAKESRRAPLAARKTPGAKRRTPVANPKAKAARRQ